MLKRINIGLLKKKSLTRHFFKNKISFISSLEYTNQMYKAWSQNPESVHESWQEYFEQNKQNLKMVQSTPKQESNFLETNRVINLIRTYQRLGHLYSHANAVNIPNEYKSLTMNQIQELVKDRLSLEYHGFSEKDLNHEFMIYTENVQGLMGEKNPIKLEEIITRLKKSYCDSIAPEFLHVLSRDECNFLRNKFENEWPVYNPSRDTKMKIHDHLAWPVLFEEFLQNKFTTAKRFGLEGLEGCITGMKAVVRRSAELGVKSVNIGMAHRGRLNVLANVLKKPIAQILAEFQGIYVKEDNMTSGDVKYHLGTDIKRRYKDGLTVDINLLFNPSHLECINPVVQGITYSNQVNEDDINKDESLAIIIHGDAAFAGQGVNYEALQMANLKHFSTGGDIHVIFNNNIGFTATPKDGRSTIYCTDLAKAFDLPVIHVNANDPIAINFCFNLAAEYRKKFKKSIFIDVVGYRKHGHNELDQPLFTQPLLYKDLNKQENVLRIYEKQLIEQKVASHEELELAKNKIKGFLENYLKESKTIKHFPIVPSSRWKSLQEETYLKTSHTGLSIDKLRDLGIKISTLPEELEVHPQVQKIYQARLESIKNGVGIDWATGEALAFSSLITEGKTVRLSGQDVERGTFSHRHAIVHDQNKDSKYCPINSLTEKRKFHVGNSHLSEFAVLGFELGYSYYDPNHLVIWEAQFGDFANGAQTIIDQFIASQETKWGVQSGLVLLLPHGMDGLGAEHSSCRVERFLHMTDDDPREVPDFSIMNDRVKLTNIQIANPTTSANYFHVLRRQLYRRYRKPLIIPSPKKLLKFRLANSNIEDFATNEFIKVREEENKNILKNPLSVKRILACSGQVYYDLVSEREKLKREDVAIVCLEQLGPFPYRQFKAAIENFKNAELFWVQEEHMNYGPWNYVRPRISSLMKKHKILKTDKSIEYIGRGPLSSPAVGHHGTHELALQKFVKEAFE